MPINRLRVSLDHLSLSQALFDERRFDVSFGDSSRRRLLRCLSLATSPPVALLGDHSRWFSSRRRSSLSVAFLKSKVCWFSLSVGLLLQAFPRWLKSKLSPQIERGSSHTQPEMEPRKRIVCGLSARGIIPSLSEEDRDDDVVPLPQEDTVEVVEISDEEEEEDMVELSREEYMSNMGYLIKVEESEDDIEPEFRRMLERMKEEEKKLREEKFKVLNSGIKLEKGQSSKGDGNKRKRRR
ncbi:hypothetical protein HID58_072282 [Brassica napus]|uniref:Uncharacterized protein n=1 Tax=Brassica napus TaxID=3708 RepID=A0ABQ7Z3Z4_BRANA|nr:hypothetical protein HID58_072282 [Brassica napus]